MLVPPMIYVSARPEADSSCLALGNPVKTTEVSRAFGTLVILLTAVTERIQRRNRLSSRSDRIQRSTLGFTIVKKIICSVVAVIFTTAAASQRSQISGTAIIVKAPAPGGGWCTGSQQRQTKAVMTRK